MKKFVAILVISVLFVSGALAQEKNDKEVTQAIHYSFTKVTSIDQIDKLTEGIEKLKHVVKVKSAYKEENQAGQVVVIITQTVYHGEGRDQQYFDVRDLKRLIIENDLMPNEISIETIKK